MTGNRTIRITVAFVLAFVLWNGEAASAQRLSEGALRGWVRDETGATVGTAVITLRDRLTGAATTIESERWGEYAFNLVAAGEYDLIVEAFGHRPLRIEGVQVRGGETTRLDAVVRTTRNADPGVDVQYFSAAAGGVSGRYTGRDLARYPWSSRELSAVSRLSSASDRSLGTEGLPGRMSAVYVNGIPTGTALSPAGAVVTPAFPLSAFRQAEFLTTSADVEWSSGATPGLSAQMMTAGSRLEVRSFGEWTTSSEQSGALRAPVYSGLQAGAVVSGPLVADTSSFVLGFETWRLETPIAFAPRLDSIADRVASVADQTYGEADAGAPVRLARSDAFSGFAALDWRLGENNALAVSAAVTSLPRSRLLPVSAERAGSGTKTEGMDAFASVSLATRFNDRFGQELRFAWDRTVRDFGVDEDGVSTLFVNDALGIGPDPALVGRYATQTLRVREALHFSAGKHLVKGGFSADLASHDHTFQPPNLNVFWFSSADAFASGAGYVVQTSGSSGVSFKLPRYGLFAQDEISVSSRLRFLVGARWDMDDLPLDDVVPNVDWFVQTGLGGERAPKRHGRISPRVEIEWRPDAGGRWALRGVAGTWDGAVDPLLMGELLANNGRSLVYRGYGAFADWPESGTQQGVPSLTLLAPGFQGARSTRAAVQVSHRVSSGIEIQVGGVARRTEFLPRRVDLNRATDAAGTDQYGRPLFGTLVQQGGMLTAEPGSNRRFAGFDVVSSIGVDGWSEYKAVNAAINAHLTKYLTLEARYTYSKTRDNWFMAREAAGAGAMAPFDAAEGDDWTEGVSDFDIPHRAIVGATLDLPVLGGVRLSGLYHVQSGQPFTPGFREGVDANGDGSPGNDPAYIDADVAGFDAVASTWDCVGSNAGAFAVRNSCRAENVAFLDARLAIGLFGTSFGRAELVFDALNLVSRGTAIPDRALYLVDASRALEQADDVTTVPLVTNPNFGSPLVRTMPGRMFRIGLSLKY